MARKGSPYISNSDFMDAEERLVTTGDRIWEQYIAEIERLESGTTERAVALLGDFNACRRGEYQEPEKPPDTSRAARQSRNAAKPYQPKTFAR